MTKRAQILNELQAERRGSGSGTYCLFHENFEQRKLADNTFVTKWFAGINCIILLPKIQFYYNTLAKW